MNSSSIISSVTDPGLRGAERVTVSLYSQKAYLTSSMVFHKQILASAFDKIYSFSPNVRLEPKDNARSGRHLVEFCQLDLEEADCTYEHSMNLAENMLIHLHEEVIARCGSLLSALGRTLKVPKAPFKRYDYGSLLAKAKEMGLSVRYGEELPQAVESKVSQEVGGFFWITDYPKTCRGFYYRESPNSQEVYSMDLVYPEGFGEAISGGEREYEAETIRRKVLERGLEPEGFEEFLSMAGPDLRPTSGFGIGIERLVRYLAGVNDIGLVRAFPKTPGQVVM